MSDDTGLYEYVASYVTNSYAPLRAILLDHVCVLLHGSLYPMMDHFLIR